MRQLSTAALAALNLSNTKFFLLAEIGFDPVVRITSTSFPIVFKGQTYSADGGIVSFGPPRVSSSIDRETYELVFLDHSNFFQGQLRVGVNGKVMTVYAGFFDASGAPLLSEADVLIAYKGFIDSGKIQNDLEKKLCVIMGASPMANLDAIGGYIVSKDGMDQVSSTDTSFDDVYVGGKTVNLKWGKV